MTNDELVQYGYEKMVAVFREYLSPEDTEKVLGLYRELAAYGVDQKKLQKDYIDMVKTESTRTILLTMVGQMVTCWPDDEVENI